MAFWSLRSNADQLCWAYSRCCARVTNRVVLQTLVFGNAKRHRNDSGLSRPRRVHLAEVEPGRLLRTCRANGLVHDGIAHRIRAQPRSRELSSDQWKHALVRKVRWLASGRLNRARVQGKTCESVAVGRAGTLASISTVVLTGTHSVPLDDDSLPAVLRLEDDDENVAAAAPPVE